jgi:hypothetical protein
VRLYFASFKVVTFCIHAHVQKSGKKERRKKRADGGDAGPDGKLAASV